MKINDLFLESKNFFQKQMDAIKDSKKKEVKELKKIENKLKLLEKKEKNTEDHLVWNNKTMLKFWLFALLIAFLGFVGYNSLAFIYLILSAFIISIAVEAIIDFFQKIMPRGLSIALTYLLVVIFVLSGVVFIIPFLAGQFGILIDIGVSWLSGIQDQIISIGLDGWIANMAWLPDYLKEAILNSIGDPTVIQDLQIKLQENMDKIIGTGSEYAKNIGTIVANFLIGFFEVIWKIALVLTLSVLFSIEKKSVINFVGNLGGKNKEYLKVKLERLYKKLGLWLKGQLLLCVFIGVAMAIALLIMSAFGVEIPKIGSIALIAGLTELIPYLGPVLGGIPAIFIVLLHNGIYAALIMVAVIFLIQWLENNVLIPLVMNKTLGVNPVTIFISMLLGGLIMGFVGVLLAVPIAVILTIFFGHFEHEEEEDGEIKKV